MNYKYRVTLEGIKGFYRVYVVSSENSLYTFHKQLRSDLEFPLDQPILFKAFSADGQVVARYALMDIGNGAVDSIFIKDVVKNGITKFVYFYDTISKKSITITFEGETDLNVDTPSIIDTKGPLPIDFEKGYVAFEDLPQEHRHLPGDRCSCGKDDCDGDCDNEDLEDDDDVDEDEEDKNEEEIVYDENE